MAWNVTFYYQQQLRSAYMNNLLKGMIKPGIYNMDCALYTVDDRDDVSKSGVYISINPGAVMVFSNTYDTSSGKFIRDFSKTGTYLIKCVYEGTEPYKAPIADFSESRASDMFLENPAQPGKPLLPVSFVTAWLNYDPEASTTATPTFQLCAPANNPLILEGNSNYSIPNEDMSTAGGLADSDISYLILGTILYNGKFPAPFAEDGSLASGWAASPRSGAHEWVESHVFTARGLPDYKGSFNKSFTSGMPDIIFAKDYGKWYLTSGQFYFNSILSKVDGTDWKALYGQAGSAPSALWPNGCGIDQKYATSAATAYTANSLTLNASNSGKVIIDAFFLAIRSEYSRAVNPDLSTLLTGSTYESKLRILPYRTIVNASGVELKTTTLGSSYGLQGTEVVPLDLSISNVARLKSLVTNRNILLPIIDTIRQNAEASPFLDPTVGESLIPIAIAFRQVEYTGSVYQIKDPQSFVNASYFNNANLCNPANVLNYFELQNSSFAILGVDLAAQEVFDTLPLID